MDTMQNVWQVRMTPKPSRKQLEVRAAAERAYRSRRVAQLQAGHDLADWALELSLKDSGRRRTMLDTPNVLV
jgi:hypothetical protein